jgi:hypothetical protein
MHDETLRTFLEYSSCVRFQARKATVSFVMSGCLSVRLSSCDILALTGRIFIKFDIWVLFGKVSEENFKFRSYLTGIFVNLHESLCVFMITSRKIFLPMRNTGWSKSLCAPDDYNRIQCPHNWWYEDGHHRTHSECGPCSTEHSIREHSSACQ